MIFLSDREWECGGTASQEPQEEPQKEPGYFAAGSNLVVRMLPDEERESAGGIVLPGQERLQQAVVLHVGPHVEDDFVVDDEDADEVVVFVRGRATVLEGDTAVLPYAAVLASHLFAKGVM